MSQLWKRVATGVSALTIAGVALAGAQSSDTQRDTYTWNAEFVSFDAGARTVTVKSRLAYPETVSALKHFEPGDRVWIVWSGVHDHGDAVRQIRRPETATRIDQDLVMPADLLSSEAPNQYITIRVKVPEGGASAIQSLTPGEWVTFTARHRPATDEQALVAVKPYNAKHAMTTSN